MEDEPMQFTPPTRAHHENLMQQLRETCENYMAAKANGMSAYCATLTAEVVNITDRLYSAPY